MDLAVAERLVFCFWTYLATGLSVAPGVVFLLGTRIDPGLARSGIGAKLIVLPGACLLWPLIVARALRGRSDASGRASEESDARSKANA